MLCSAPEPEEAVVGDAQTESKQEEDGPETLELEDPEISIGVESEQKVVLYSDGSGMGSRFIPASITN